MEKFFDWIFVTQGVVFFSIQSSIEQSPLLDQNVISWMLDMCDVF